MMPLQDVGCRLVAERLAGRGIPLKTLIATADGTMPVEYLLPGDRVITRRNGLQTLRQIIPHEETCERVQIAAGSLGHTGPGENTVLPHAQPVFIRDWRAPAVFGKDEAVVPASRLVDGQYVKHMGPQTMHLFELVFDAAQIIFAGALELTTKTTVDTFNAWQRTAEAQAKDNHLVPTQHVAQP